jgi:hypothetical protein
MEWYFYNTDAKAFGGASEWRRLIAKRLAVTGGPRKFGEQLRQLQEGDILLMYHNGTGVVAVGEVLGRWDTKTHRDRSYYDEPGPEYRVSVHWFGDIAVNPITPDELGYIPRGAVQRIVKEKDRIRSLVEDRLSATLPLEATDIVNEGIEGDEFRIKLGDQRLRVVREIVQRQGSQKFRNSLRRRYGDKCLVTGCSVLPLLEAAHIKEYRVEDDNNAQNGLLLRADIHTLFDLDLLGIDSRTLRVELHPAVEPHYRALVQDHLLCSSTVVPSRPALELRFNRFKKRRRRDL